MSCPPGPVTSHPTQALNFMLKLLLGWGVHLERKWPLIGHGAKRQSKSLVAVPHPPNPQLLLLAWFMPALLEKSLNCQEIGCLWLKVSIASGEWRAWEEGFEGLPKMQSLPCAFQTESPCGQSRAAHTWSKAKGAPPWVSRLRGRPSPKTQEASVGWGRYSPWFTPLLSESPHYDPGNQAPALESPPADIDRHSTTSGAPSLPAGTGLEASPV